MRSRSIQRRLSPPGLKAGARRGGHLIVPNNILATLHSVAEQAPARLGSAYSSLFDSSIVGNYSIRYTEVVTRFDV